MLWPRLAGHRGAAPVQREDRNCFAAGSQRQDCRPPWTVEAQDKQERYCCLRLGVVFGGVDELADFGSLFVQVG
jgi:hypothetical protein